MNENAFIKKRTIEPHLSDAPDLGYEAQFYFVSKIATEKDWGRYKDLMLEGATGPDAKLFGYSRFEKKSLENRADVDWKRDLSRKELFAVLVETGSMDVGMGLSMQDSKDNDVWNMIIDYIRPEFRGSGMGKYVFALRLDEIIKRGGKKAVVDIGKRNERHAHIAEMFGAQKLCPQMDYTKEKFLGNCKYEIDLTDKDVLSKINITLNER